MGTHTLRSLVLQQRFTPSHRLIPRPGTLKAQGYLSLHLNLNTGSIISILNFVQINNSSNVIKIVK